jgi:predicted nucleotidyltransferase
MTRDEALARLRPHEHELREAGLRALYLFGSTARNEAKRRSDVDLLCEIDDDKELSLLDFIGVKHRLSDLLGSKTDLLERRGLRPGIRERVEPELVQVF